MSFYIVGLVTYLPKKILIITKKQKQKKQNERELKLTSSADFKFQVVGGGGVRGAGVIESYITFMLD